MFWNVRWVLLLTLIVGLLAGCADTSSPPIMEEPSETEQAAQEVEPRDYSVPAEEAARENPIPADEASVQRGEEIYTSICIDCHGEDGQGDGPAAANQNPKPVDYNAEHVRALTDGELFYIITNGVEGTSMIPFNFFEEEQRWHLVNYIRSLQE